MAMVDVGHIFRSYDIRGIYGKDLDEEIMEHIGNVFGQYCKGDIVLGRDSRSHSKNLREAFAMGFIKTGKNIIDVGEVPLGVGMFYAWQNGKDFTFITASHLTKEWNGVKFFHADGMGYMENENFAIRDKFFEGKFISEKTGTIQFADTSIVAEQYKKYLSDRIKPQRRIKVVLDCGNGMAGVIAKRLFSDSGFIVSTIFEDVDCTFPNRNPEPQEDELVALKKKIKEERADIGIAFDGDGDRILLLDDEHRKLTPEQTAYLILKEAAKESGPIVANVECTRMIDDIAKNVRKGVFRFPVGHTFLVNEAKKRKACFGIEVSGHYVLPFIFPFDDSMAVSLYAAYVLSKISKPLSKIVDEIKTYPFTREKFEVDDKLKPRIIENIKKKLSKEKNVNTMDGIRVDFENGWVLIRASNTSPIIRLTVEGNDQASLEEIKNRFSKTLQEEINKLR
jgi:phosphomannomutase